MLKIFLALLPLLLAFMGRLQGLHSQSLVDFSVINKYYIFQARALSCLVNSAPALQDRSPLSMPHCYHLQHCVLHCVLLLPPSHRFVLYCPCHLTA